MVTFALENVPFSHNTYVTDDRRTQHSSISETVSTAKNVYCLMTPDDKRQCFTSSCAYHLITVTTFALTIYLTFALTIPQPFNPEVKLICFTDPFLHSLSGSFWTACSRI